MSTSLKKKVDFSSLEKFAAVKELCAQGCDFELAVNLVKQAALSEENKATIKTTLLSGAASLPADIAGSAVGAHLGNKYLRDISFKIPTVNPRTHIGKGALGQFIGMGLGGGLASLAATKYSLHDKIKES